MIEAQHGARWATETGLAPQQPFQQMPTPYAAPTQPYYVQPPVAMPGQPGQPGGPGGGYYGTGAPAGGYPRHPSKKGMPVWLIVVLAVSAVVVVFGVIGIIFSPSDPAEDGPAAEKEFVAIVKKGQDAADGNEVAVVKAREERADDMCAALPKSLEVTDWVGTVDEVDTTLGGDSGVLDIDIADDINVSTWNNAVSDLGDGTLIDPDSKVYDVLADLEEGDTVKFSGEFIGAGDDCISEQSLFDDNGMRTPAFLMKFTAVSQN